MSDLDDWKALLTRTRVRFRELPHDDMTRYQAESGATVLLIDAEKSSDYVNDGYFGFGVDLSFDHDGKLLRAWIGE